MIIWRLVCLQKGKSQYLSMGWGKNPYGKLTPTALIVSDCTARCLPMASSLCHSEFRIKWVQADKLLCVFLGERRGFLFVVQCSNIHFIQQGLGGKKISREHTGLNKDGVRTNALATPVYLSPQKNEINTRLCNGSDPPSLAHPKLAGASGIPGCSRHCRCGLRVHPPCSGSP